MSASILYLSGDVSILPVNAGLPLDVRPLPGVDYSGLTINVAAGAQIDQIASSIVNSATIVLSADADYTYAVEGGSVVVTDANGDTVITLPVEDDGSGTFVTPSVQIGEDGAPTQIQVTGDGEVDTTTTPEPFVNQAPTAEAATVDVAEDDAAVTGQLVATDDGGVENLTFALDAPVEGLTLNADGSYTFDPAANSAAQGLVYSDDPLSIEAAYTVTDAEGEAASSTLTLTVAPTPLTFELAPSAVTVDEGTTQAFTLTASEPVTEDTDVTFTLVPGDGSAADAGSSNTNTDDFAQGAFNPTTVTIAAGDTEASFDVSPLDDGVTELPEDFTVTAEVNGETLETTGTVQDSTDPEQTGETFTLTPGTDEGPAFVGTENDDIYDGSLSQVQDGSGFTELQTLTNTDVLDGGDGVDRLNATLIDAATSPGQIKNIEQFYLNSSKVASAIGMANVEGVEQVWSDNSTKDLTVANLQNGVTLGAKDGNGSDLTASYGANTIGTNFTQNVVLQDADVGTLTVNAGGSNSISGLALDVTGTDAELALGGALNSVTDVNVEGDAGLDISGSTLTNLETLTSTTTGDLSVSANGGAIESVTTGEGDDTLAIVTNDLADGAAIDLGAGDDRLELGSNLVTTNTVSLNGGAGMNTLAMDVATAAAVSGNAGFVTQVENFQNLELGEVATGDSDTVNLANMNGIDYVTSAGTDAANVTTPAVSEVQTISVNSGADSDGGILTVGGVDIAISGFASAANVATAIANQEAAIIAANGTIDSVEVDPYSTSDVLVTYADTAGDVSPNISVSDNASGVTVSAVTEQTAGIASAQEVQDITVGTAAAQSGTFTVGGVDVDVLVGDATGVVAGKIGTALGNNLPTGVSSVSVSGSVVSVTYEAAAGDAPLLSITGGDALFGSGNSPSIAETTPGGTGGTAEVQTFTVTGSDTDGGELVIGGVKVAIDGGMTADEVGSAIVAKQADIKAANADIDSIGYNTTGSVVTVTYKDTAGDVPLLSASSNDTTGVTASVSETTAGQQFVGTPAGTLTLDEMASGGTLELTDILEGDATVNVTDASSGSDDELNVKLNGATQLANTAALNVAAVETINVETANSDDTLLPTGESWLDLQAADAETVTVSGNHGVDFWGSDLSSMTEFDASGVQASESSAGADDAGTVGAVFIDTGATDADVTIKTGNGDDYIDAWFVGTGTTDAVGATIEAGTGDDFVIGSKGDDNIDLGAGNDIVVSTLGADAITLGDGNDAYVLEAAPDSTISEYDTILDFNPNTLGQGGGQGADVDLSSPSALAADLEGLDGDVIALVDFNLTGTSLDVETFANASDATTFLANNSGDGAINIGLDSSSGLLYIDIDDNGIANSVIELQGVTTIDEAAFVI